MVQVYELELEGAVDPPFQMFADALLGDECLGDRLPVALLNSRQSVSRCLISCGSWLVSQWRAAREAKYEWLVSLQ